MSYLLNTRCHPWIYPLGQLHVLCCGKGTNHKYLDDSRINIWRYLFALCICQNSGIVKVVRKDWGIYGNVTREGVWIGMVRTITAMVFGIMKQADEAFPRFGENMWRNLGFPCFLIVNPWVSDFPLKQGMSQMLPDPITSCTHPEACEATGAASAVFSSQPRVWVSMLGARIMTE